MGVASYQTIGIVLDAIGVQLAKQGAQGQAAARYLNAAALYADGIQGAVEEHTAGHVAASMAASIAVQAGVSPANLAKAMISAAELLGEGVVISEGAPIIAGLALSFVLAWAAGEVAGYAYDLGVKFLSSLRKHDPLVLDLNGDGLSLTSVNTSNTYFNFGDGDFASKTGWVAPTDGILALDRDGNGHIDGISDLFGSDTSDGFSALSELDSNHDGVINSIDTQFAQLKVWQDYNADGIAQDSEVSSLASLNIASISLSTTQANLSIAGNSVPLTSQFTRSDGTQGTVGAVSFTDNRIFTSYQFPDGFTFDPEVFGLPNLKGYGDVPDLWVAMTLDPTLKQMVKDLVTKGSTIDSVNDVVGGINGAGFVMAAGGAGVPIYEEDDFERMMHRWSQVVPGSASDYDVSAHATFTSGDPGTLAAFMTITNDITQTAGAFLGRPLPAWTVVNPDFYSQFQQFATDYATMFFTQVAGLEVGAASYTVGQNFAALTDSTSSPTAQQIAAAMQPLSDALANPTQWGPLVQSLTGLHFDPGANSLSGDPSAYIDLLLADEDWSPSDPWSGYVTWGVEHSHELDTVDPSRTATLLGMRRHTDNHALPILFQTIRNDVTGTASGETLLGTDGNVQDLLNGLGGNDVLRGGAGYDTYLFQDGCGSDTVIDTSGNDEIAFQGSLVSSLARFSFANGNRSDLLISFDGRPETVTIPGYFAPSGIETIETISFADGIVADPRVIRDAVFATLATGNADVISGFTTSETIVGGAGADTLDGLEGDDTLIGGTGNDTLYGSGGNDTFQFNPGDGADTIIERGGGFYGGNDTIRFGEGIDPEDVTVTQSANGQDLILKVNGTTDQITIVGTMVNSDDRVEQVIFSNGKVWSNADLVQMSIANDTDGTAYGSYDSESLAGTAGADVLDGREGDDVITGGTGNDTLYGSGGNDTFRFARGDGQDTIIERGVGFYGGNDTIEFMDGVLPSDITVTQSANGQDLILKISGTTDQITVKYDMVNSDDRVEQVKFADGTIWSHAQLVQMSINADADGTVYGSYDSETLTGTAGADVIDGREGDDIIIGGTGNDTLYGSGGNDTFRFNRGDGQDKIIERGGGFYGGNDTIELGAGIALSDLTVVQANNGQDLVLKINGTTDQITIVSTMVNSDYRVEQVKLADGTVLSHAQLVQMSVGANSGNDTFYGSYDSETIDGGPGNDVIDGREGDDIIIGGTGNDTLYGSGGNDTFRFARGDGQDFIHERGVGFYGGTDTVEFAAGIAPTDVTVVQADSGHDLILKINGTTDQITLDETLVNSDDQIEFVKFADGTVWTASDLVQKSSGGTPGNDTLYGDTGNNMIDGGAGDDTIEGSGGDDILIGGTGNDLLYGSAGNDTFRFNRGDGWDTIKERGNYGFGGNDTIEFGAGIAVSDISVSQANGYNDLIIKINGTSDRITLWGDMNNSDYRIEQVKFADGTVLTHAQLVQMSLANNGDNDTFYGTYDSETLNGGAGDDTINGMGGTDIIIGGTGNDYLTDGGNATYRFARGDGQDVVKAGAGSDTIEFAAGVAASDLTVSEASNGADLVIKINGTNDQITVRSTLVDGYSRLEQVRFADGSTLTHAQLVQLALANNGGNDVMFGSYDAETINGGAGDDIINGQGGNDIIIGGTGNDYVTGSGNLTFRFARGDGQDIVKASAGFDTIEFAAGIAASDLTIVQAANGADLVIKINGTSDQITVKSTMVDGYSRLEQVRFADGSTLTHAQLVQMSFANSSGNDTFYGSYDAETITGGAGDDVITGQGGNDILIGGTGNDVLSGTGGVMTYRFARGDGQDVVKANGGTDTIEFAAGIAASDLSVVQANGGNDLVIRINGTSDQITIPNTMTNGSWRLEQARFADGSTLSHAQLVQMSYANNAGANTFYGSYDAETITGGAGADFIDGRSGDDIIIGGTGDDMLGGSSGNDTYRFARGDGRDIIKDSTANGSGGNDTIEFAAGIAASDLIVEQASNGADLIIKISGTTDQITISADISDPNSRIEQVKFSDGSTLTYAQLLALTSTVGNDTINGDTLANTLDGGAGNDLIDARAGDDILIGGTGNDWLGGSSGNDTYRFGRGDGEDVIRDATANGSGGTDTLELGTGIALPDLSVAEANGGNDLILKINGTTDQVTLSSTMNDGSNRIEQVKLADGSILTHAQLVQMAVASNSGDDLFWGTYDAETIDGGAGDDVIDARGGDDILIGGTGNDVLGGSSGNDTYRFGRGDGQDIVRDSNASGAGGTDTLELGAGIAQSDITVVQANGGNDLIIKINGTNDQVTLASTVNDGNNRIEQVRFADGSILTNAQLMSLAFSNNSGNDSFYGSWEANTIDGGAGNDSLIGWDGDDILIGGAGNDVLSGGFGNDTYRFSRGDGQDVISDAMAGGYRGNDTLELGAGIAASDLTVVQGNNGNDLVIKINGTSDQVTLANTMTSSDYRIEQVKLADGSILTHAQLVQMSFANNSGNDTFYGSYDSETINGGAGDDYLIGNDGNDILIGGAGNDVLAGGFGNDTYVFARGDGQDIVYDAKAGGYRGNETIQFAAGIAPSDITVTEGNGGEDLILKINGTTDQIDLAYTLNYFDDRIEQVTFADGTVWTHADLVQRAFLNNAGNNSFYGSYDGETIDGGAGNDFISAKDGNDTVIGGDGDDVLDGGNGTDTASFASSSTGVTVNLSLTTMQNTVGAGYDVLTNFENLTGSAFNDTLIGSSGANLIVGGAGNDLINGGAGSDTAKVAGMKASYTLQTVGGQVQLVDNDAVTDGNDGTDTLIGIETVQFKDQSMGIVSPIILDLDGNGVQTISASASRARFDMNGDGIADDTSWIGTGDGFLFLDRDGNGTLSGIGEMSFADDLAGARTDLEGLKAFDSNNDSMISASDARFGDFRIWRDRNGDGSVQAGEILTLGDVGLASISLTTTAVSSTLKPGDVATVNAGTWTRADGSANALADAMMTYFSGPSSDDGKQPNPGRSAVSGVPNWGQVPHRLALSDVDDEPPVGRALGSLSAGAAHRNPVYAVQALDGADAAISRRLASMAQDLAAFGADAPPMSEHGKWENVRPLDLFAA